MRTYLKTFVVLLLGFGLVAFAAAGPSSEDISSDEAPMTSSAAAAPGEYHESPMLAERVAAGQLPPVDQRLPPEPVVVEPADEIGQYGGTLNIGLTGTFSWFGDGQSALGPDTLFRILPDYSWVGPNLIREWEWTPDGKTMTIHLIEGAKWSDGEPFDASAIMFWYDHILLNEELTATIPTRWAPGGEVMQLTQLDDYTIRYDFAAPYPVIEVLYGHYEGGPNRWGPAHYLEQFHPDFVDRGELEAMAESEGFDEWFQLFNNKNRVCSVNACGGQPTMQAYMLVASNPQAHTLERNPYYWKVDPAGNQLPYIDNVVLNIIQDTEVLNLKAIQGEFDLFGQNSDLANFPVYQDKKERGGYEVYNWLTTDANQIAFNFNLTIDDPVKREIFQDVRFRQAFSQALNRDEINEARWFGLATPMAATAHPMTPWYREEYANMFIEYDPDLSNRLLDEMGLDERNSNGIRLMSDGRPLQITFEYPPDTHTWMPPVVELLLEYMDDIGIDLEVKTDDRSLYSERVGQNLVEMNEWGTVGFTTTMLIDPRVFVPFRTGDETIWYTKWMWYNTSGGERGEVPPPEIQKIIDWHAEYTTSVDLDRRDEIIDMMLRDHVENLYTIGVIGNVMKPILVNKDLGNVPTEGAHGYDAIRLTPNHPETFYFKNL